MLVRCDINLRDMQNDARCLDEVLDDVCCCSWTVAGRLVLRTTGAVPGTTTHHLPAETSCRRRAASCSTVTCIIRTLLMRFSVRSRQSPLILNRTSPHWQLPEDRCHLAMPTRPKMSKLRSLSYCVRPVSAASVIYQSGPKKKLHTVFIAITFSTHSQFVFFYNFWHIYTIGNLQLDDAQLAHLTRFV